MQDDAFLLSDLAAYFRDNGRSEFRKANEPEHFQRIAYLAKAALDRRFGPGNRHSLALVRACSDAALDPTVTRGYARVAVILQTAARSVEALQMAAEAPSRPVLPSSQGD